MRELEAKLQVKGKVEWRDPAYWVADGPQANGPCCQKCYDTEGKLVRLQDDRDGTYSCMACKCQYSTPERRSRIVAALSQSRQKASGPY